jgi:GAF domain
VVFGVLLDALLDLMNSEYGFIGEVKYEDDGTIFLQTKSTTNIAWNDETRKFYEDNVANGLKFYNMNSLFGKCIMAKQVVISNDPKIDSRACGIPSGHPPLNHFLGKALWTQCVSASLYVAVLSTSHLVSCPISLSRHPLL